jgi:hypothetical protein
MKPRRENGATLVSPMISEVSRGSALIGRSSFLGGAFGLQSGANANHLLERCGAVGARSGPKIGHKKQGRRRNIPSTTLPAPDIKIGSRHPVNFTMPGILAGMCEPVHKGGKKLRQRVP